MADAQEEDGNCLDPDAFLCRQSKVEVTTDEEGFKGAWYEAKILNPPKNPKSDIKEDRLALVEFQTLLSEDGVSLLVETADAHFIRPSPPQETAGASVLEMNDIVDAFHLDGWWTGVVAKVLGKERYLVTFEDPPDAMELGREDLRTHWDWVGGLWVRSKKLRHIQGSESQKKKNHHREERTFRRKRGRPPKVRSGSVNALATGTVSNGAANNSSGQALSAESHSLAGVANSTSSPVGNIKQMDEKMEMETGAMEMEHSLVKEESQSLPFVKSSPIWQAVDSMEVLKKFPQKPHFLPLFDCKKDSREGLAIAHMVTFSSMVQKAFELHINDPMSSFTACLEALHDLECHGFDVKPTENHLKKLLSVKDKQQKLQEKSKNVENRISELTRENERIDEEIVELGQKLKRLKLKKEKNDMKLGVLRKSVEFLNKAMERARIDFEDVTHSPW